MGGPSKTFDQVLVWRKAHALVLAVYEFTATFPRCEAFGLTAQLRRAAVSVPANFAEGFKKTGRADKARFYNVAQGSIEECRYYFMLAKDLGYGDTVGLLRALEEVSRMLEAYCRSVRLRASSTDY